jgi:hypothetical protein
LAFEAAQGPRRGVDNAVRVASAEHSSGGELGLAVRLGE